MTKKEWVQLNWKVGAFSFGGGGRSIYFQDALVEKSTELSEDEFQEAATITQLVPGPNLVNLAMYLGIRLVGLKWMFLGFLVLCVPGALFGILFFEVINLDNPITMLLFKGFSLGSVTFFVVFVYRLAKGLRVGIGSHVPQKRLFVRIVLTALVCGSSLYGIPLFWVLALAIPTALLAEFQIWV